MSTAIAQPLYQPDAYMHQKLTLPAYLDAIQEGDPAAAHILYAMHADQIRSYLRRHTGIRDVEHAVFSVLVETVRSLQGSGTTTLEQISRAVRDLAQQGVFALRRSQSGTASTQLSLKDTDGELINSVFTVLNQTEREILAQSLLLSKSDDEIARDLNLPEDRIRSTQLKARVLLRISSGYAAYNAEAAQA